MGGRMGQDAMAGGRETLSGSVALAYREIRAWIIGGTLAPGQELRESDLAERIGVSRTPVRAALSRLETEGLVVYERYRRYEVVNLTAGEIDKIFEIRVELEGLAARRAATRIGAEALADLARLTADMQAAADTPDGPDVTRFDALNTAFHEIIVQAADNRRLETMLAGLIDLPLAHLARYQAQMKTHLDRSCQHHREIIAALDKRNPVWAEAQMRAHLLSLRDD